jgi:hypothetical protein
LRVESKLWATDDSIYITLHGLHALPETIRKSGTFTLINEIPKDPNVPVTGSWLDGHDEMEFCCNGCGLKTKLLAELEHACAKKLTP